MSMSRSNLIEIRANGRSFGVENSINGHEVVEIIFSHQAFDILVELDILGAEGAVRAKGHGIISITPISWFMGVTSIKRLIIRLEGVEGEVAIVSHVGSDVERECVSDDEYSLERIMRNMLNRAVEEEGVEDRRELP